jgi:hypothetical protein
MIKMAIEDILAEAKNFTTEQKKNYITNSTDYWVPNQAFRDRNEWAAECGFNSFTEMLSADNDKITDVFINMLSTDLDPRYNEGLTEEQIKSWLN